MRLWVFYTTSVQVKYRLRKTPEFVTNNKNILSSVRWRKNLLSSLFESWENFTESTYLPKNNLLGFDDISQHGIKGRKEIRFEQFAATIHVKFREDCLYVLVYKLWSDNWLQTDKFTFDQMQSYQTSVVERECVEGIINTDYVTKYTTLAFLRKIDDINMSDTRGGKYF